MYLFFALAQTGYATEAEMNALEKNMQSADAFILMYSVTDKGSFEDCCRLRLLISLNKSDTRRWSLLNRVSRFYNELNIQVNLNIL